MIIQEFNSQAAAAAKKANFIRRPKFHAKAERIIHETAG
jgi:hypothetical protein